MPTIADRSHQSRVVAVYRWSLLPASETFIRSEALALRRYSPLFVGHRRQDGLELPPERVVVGAPEGLLQRVLRGRVGALAPDGPLVKACRRRGVALIHAHFGPDGVGALELARALDVPLIVTFWGYDATIYDEELLQAGGSAAEYVRRRSELFDSAALLVGVSRFITDELRSRGAPAAKLRVHHTGVWLQPAPAWIGRQPVVLFVGRHVEKKGLGDLIEAMPLVRRSVPTARLVVVGDGPLRARNEERARQLELDADFVGWLTPEAVAEQLRSVRVLCVPSRRATSGDAEGLPTVIPEACAHGLPIVATRHSGIPEAIAEDRGGLLADEGDVDGIASHLAAVLTDDALWRRLSAGAHENIRLHFDPERQTAELEGFYDEVLRARR